MDIAYICIFAGDFDGSVIFYRDKLGLEEDLSRSAKNFHALKAGNIFIGIERNGFRKGEQKTKAENAVLIQFKASTPVELKEITEKLEAKGVQIVDRLVETAYGTFTNFLDPDGNKLEVLYQS